MGKPNTLDEIISEAQQRLGVAWDRYEDIANSEYGLDEYAEDFDFAWDSLKLNVQNLINEVIGDDEDVRIEALAGDDIRKAVTRNQLRDRQRAKLTKLNGGK